MKYVLPGEVNDSESVGKSNTSEQLDETKVSEPGGELNNSEAVGKSNNSAPAGEMNRSRPTGNSKDSEAAENPTSTMENVPDTEGNNRKGTLGKSAAKKQRQKQKKAEEAARRQQENELLETAKLSNEIQAAKEEEARKAVLLLEEEAENARLAKERTAQIEAKKKLWADAEEENRKSRVEFFQEAWRKDPGIRMKVTKDAVTGAGRLTLMRLRSAPCFSWSKSFSVSV